MQSDVSRVVASIRDAQTMVDLAAQGMETFAFARDIAGELFVVSDGCCGTRFRRCCREKLIESIIIKRRNYLEMDTNMHSAEKGRFERLMVHKNSDVSGIAWFESLELKAMSKPSKSD